MRRHLQLRSFWFRRTGRNGDRRHVDGRRGLHRRTSSRRIRRHGLERRRRRRCDRTLSNFGAADRVVVLERRAGLQVRRVLPDNRDVHRRKVVGLDSSVCPADLSHHSSDVRRRLHVSGRTELRLRQLLGGQHAGDARAMRAAGDRRILDVAGDGRVVSDPGCDVRNASLQARSDLRRHRAEHREPIQLHRQSVRSERARLFVRREALQRRLPSARAARPTLLLPHLRLTARIRRRVPTERRPRGAWSVRSSSAFNVLRRGAAPARPEAPAAAASSTLATDAVPRR